MASPMSLMTDGHDAPAEMYQIRVQGRPDPYWSDWLGGLAMTYAGPNGCHTLLCGPVIDQAALHGLLIKVRDLGLPLLALQRLEPDPGHGGVPAQRPGASLQQMKRQGFDLARFDTDRGVVGSLKSSAISVLGASARAGRCGTGPCIAQTSRSPGTAALP